MSREIEKIAEDLFEKVRSRFENVNLGDEAAKATNDPEKARFFNFDYVTNEENHGNVTISIIDENNLKIYFSKNISDNLEGQELDNWYSFLKELRYFAKRNLLTFDTRDISRSNLNIKDLKQVSKADSTLTTQDVAISESRLYGTHMISYENVGPARIMIKHTESVNPEQRGSRARHINAIYVENAQGERFKMQHNKLSGARAMARHVAEGGIPYDDVGQHINSMIQEMSDLGRFVRVMKHRTFEDNTAVKMVEAAANYYQGMNRQLNYLKGSRAYRNFVESFEPNKQQLDEVDVNELKERFVKKVFDDRMMAALPLVNKAYQLQEQAKHKQLESVKDIVEHRADLQLIENEGMDEYFKALSFARPADLVVRILEDIAKRGAAIPEVAEFAKHWAANFNMVNEDSDKELKENQALAVKLATHYIRDLRNLHEGLRVSRTDYNLVDFDSGEMLEEGTWALPESPEEVQALQALMSQPLEVGVDAENATSALYELIGDDELFDRLNDLADAEGPRADARDTIKYFLQQEMPGLAAKLNFGDAEMDQATNVASPAQPAPPAQPTAANTPPGQNSGGVVSEELRAIARLAGLQSFMVK